MSDLPEDFFERETLDRTLGIEFEEMGADRVVATMPVLPRVCQPFGFLHGGASVALAESVASIGANICSESNQAAFWA